MQPLFQQATGITLRLVLLGALSVSIMTLDHRFDHMHFVREQISLLIYPLQILVDLPARLGTWGASAISSQRTLLDENERLRSEGTLMRAQLQKLAALETENARLRDLLGSSSKVGDSVLVAALLAVDLDPYRQQVLINKGARHNVYTGQPVIDASGVMGQIIHTGTFTSTALLISDPSHALPVQVDRTGLRTIVTGTGNPNRLELRFIPTTADIEVDDTVFTSGLGGRFPPNYPVAIVSSVERPRGQAFARVFATPTARIDRSREVLLVWHQTEPLQSE
ncbi:MAG: rod shape-determining protein MreC [Gammaproteobacteria bacterium]|nr:rod shape-determining protein MreC [Gammaproteobacteria bacterium]